MATEPTAEPTAAPPNEGEFATGAEEFAAGSPIPPEQWTVGPLSDSAEWMGLDPITYAGDEGEFAGAPEATEPEFGGEPT